MLHLLFVAFLLSKEGSRDFYEILGVPHDSSSRSIEHSYRSLSKKYHPDKNKANPLAADKFNDINDAYSVLRDPNKRRVYDIWGEAGVRVFEAPHGDDVQSFSPSASDDEIARQVRSKSPPVLLTYPVELADFFYGRTFPLFVTRRTMCRCPEAGFACARCRGRPTTSENVTLSLVVEKGADDGTLVVFEGAGDVSEMSAPGDIVVRLVSKKNPTFYRDGDDLHTQIVITLREALLGFKKTIKGIDGDDVMVQSKAVMGSDDIIRIPSKGMPKYLYPGEFGDLIVHTKVLWPKVIDHGNREKLVSILSQEN